MALEQEVRPFMHRTVRRRIGALAAVATIPIAVAVGAWLLARDAGPTGAPRPLPTERTSVTLYEGVIGEDRWRLEASGRRSRPGLTLSHADGSAVGFRAPAPPDGTIHAGFENTGPSGEGNGVWFGFIPLGATALGFRDGTAASIEVEIVDVPDRLLSIDAFIAEVPPGTWGTLVAYDATGTEIASAEIG